jgi:hypothetical protein
MGICDITVYIFWFCHGSGSQFPELMLFWNVSKDEKQCFVISLGYIRRQKSKSDSDFLLSSLDLLLFLPTAGHRN